MIRHPAAYVAFERTVPTYTDGLVVGAIVRAVYVSELRTYVQTLEAISCAPQVSQTQVWVGAAATSTSTTVTTWGGCTWGSTSQATWLTIATGATGAGNGTVDVVVAANDTGAPRTGTVTIADRTLTVRQAADAAPTPTVSFDGVSISAAATGATSIVYYHTDAIGSVRLVTGDGGRVVARYDYLPFGVELNAPVFENTRMFTGQERDKQTSLDYVGARYFSATVGRFTTPDAPLFGDPTNPQSWNLYAYGFNNPLRYVDPTGNDPCPPGSEATFCSGVTETAPLDQGLMQFLLARWFGFALPGQIGPQTTPLLPQDTATTCPSVPFTITGIGPNQAPNTTAISQTPRSAIPNGGVAIKPRNFGVASVNGGNRAIFSGIQLYADWNTATRSGRAPVIPVGLPTLGPYTPVDVVGPVLVRIAPGNLFDVYNYTSTRDAQASTRRVMVTAVIPNNTVGVRCPH